jgi:Protein of unknown function (DUF4238)
MKTDDASAQRAVLCKFCEHWYIQPCTDSTKANCPNMIAKRARLNGSAQSSTRHHYIPVFYLKRWRGNDGKICEFSRPYKHIYTKRAYPVQTGFVDRLYEMRGVPSEIAQQVEDEFMKPADTFAARSLAMLETRNDRINYESKYRSAWSLFLMTLLIRMPEDLEVLAAAVADEWARVFPKLEEQYALKRQAEDPPTLQRFIDQKDPHHMSRWTLDLARRLMDYEGIGQLLNNMRWFVLTSSAEAPRLLTSDRPVLISATLTEDNAYVFLPIAPDRLFVAVNSKETEIIVRRRLMKELVEGTNKLIVRHAVKYVYGTDNGSVEFVDQNIGQSRPKSLMERLRDRRNEDAEAKGKRAR